MINKILALSDNDFRDLIKSSVNISEVLFKLGYTIKGNSWGFGEIKRRMVDLGIGFDQFKGKSPMIEYSKRSMIPDDKLFCDGSKHNRDIVRRRIINNNLLPYKCAICGVEKWNNKSISLELDHINGINNDNRIENLRFLCPNCHSQTTTYGSRNQKLGSSKYEISDELRDSIIREFYKTPSIDKVSKRLNLVKKVVHKVVNDLGIKKPNQVFITRYDTNHNDIARYGSISELANTLITTGELKTKNYKTARTTCIRNLKDDKLWLGSYWEIVNK